MNPTLLSELSLVGLAAAVAAGAAIDNDSAIIDMAGYEGVIFMTSIEDSVATGVATLTVEQSDANSGAAMAALAGAVATLTSGVNDDLNGKLLAVDVYRPRERYLRVNRASATANIAYGAVTAIRYGARVLPVPDGGASGDLVSVTSPAEA
ncbi:hypothetical protein [Pseudooceanicola algae]|uniref:Uncharacterized protein n=1 Tax=Pseudooceanicola algae TaxID=1537215 RepID=A0A418SDC0_9RHOB|nr:hypothetical protein [Pseudooceanicola algae]QPM89376.1 hypothetical protein PSAL_005920 [Pseudooceanicola algae]